MSKEVKRIVISESAKRKMTGKYDGARQKAGCKTEMVVYHTKVGKRIHSETRHEKVWQ